MAKTALGSLALGLMMALASGCTTLTGQSAGRNLDDTTITTKVKTELAGERMATLTRVSVTTVNSIVYLTGTVETPQDKEKAGTLAAGVTGVKEVVNNLQVQNPGTSRLP